MLVQRRRRLANIKPAMGGRLVFARSTFCVCWVSVTVVDIVLTLIQQCPIQQARVCYCCIKTGII